MKLHFQSFIISPIKNLDYKKKMKTAISNSIQRVRVHCKKYTKKYNENYKKISYDYQITILKNNKKYIINKIFNVFKIKGVNNILNKQN